MKTFVNALIFAAVVIAPLAFWVSETGLSLRQDGWGWIPFVWAPIGAAIFAGAASGKPKGKKILGQDDQGNALISRFWGLFMLLTIALIGIAVLLKMDA